MRTARTGYTSAACTGIANADINAPVKPANIIPSLRLILFILPILLNCFCFANQSA
jgi:hypothetical protein